MQATEFLMVFHVMSCIWIRLAIFNQNSWIYSKFDPEGIFYQGVTNKEEAFELSDLGDLEEVDKIEAIVAKIYYDAYYFMSTTMSCIGYGDITPNSGMPNEKLFIIIC